MNAKDFSTELNKWGKSIEKDVGLKYFKKICLEVLSRVVMKSPVDTGRFRNNWMVGVIAPNDTTTRETKDQSVVRGLGVLGTLNEYRTVHISNNLPYAMNLEKGTSTQAPAGVLEISVEEVRTFLKGEK